MRVTKEQLKRIIRETVKRKIDCLSEATPPAGSSLPSPSNVEHVSQHPEIAEAVENLLGAVATVLSEHLDEDSMEMVEQSIHTDFHNDLYEFIEDWMNTFTEAAERGEFK